MSGVLEKSQNKTKFKNTETIQTKETDILIKTNYTYHTDKQFGESHKLY